MAALLESIAETGQPALVEPNVGILVDETWAGHFVVIIRDAVQGCVRQVYGGDSDLVDIYLGAGILTQQSFECAKVVGGQGGKSTETRFGIS